MEKEKLKRVLSILANVGLRVKFVDNPQKGVVARAQTVSAEREGLTHDDDVAVIYSSGKVREWNRDRVISINEWVESLKPYLKLVPEQEEELRSLTSSVYRVVKVVQEDQGQIEEMEKVWEREKEYPLPKWFRENAVYVTDPDKFVGKLRGLAREWEEEHKKVQVEGKDPYGMRVTEEVWVPKDFDGEVPTGVFYCTNPYQRVTDLIEKTGKPVGIYYPLVDHRTGMLFGYGVRKTVYCKGEPKHLTFKVPMVVVYVENEEVHIEPYSPYVLLKGEKEETVYITESMADAVVVNEKLGVTATPMLGCQVDAVPHIVGKFKRVVFATDPDEAGRSVVKEWIDRNALHILGHNIDVAYQHGEEKDIDYVLSHGIEVQTEHLPDLLIELLKEKLERKLEEVKLIHDVPVCFGRVIENMEDVVNHKPHALSLLGLLQRADVGFRKGDPDYILLLLLLQRLGHIDLKLKWQGDTPVFSFRGEDVETTTYCGSVCSFFVDRETCQKCSCRSPDTVIAGQTRIETYSMTQKLYVVSVPCVDDEGEIYTEEVPVKEENIENPPIRLKRPIQMGKITRKLLMFAIKATIRDAKADEADEDDLYRLLKRVVTDLVGSTPFHVYSGSRAEVQGMVLFPHSEFRERIRIHAEHMRIRTMEKEIMKALKRYGWIWYESGREMLQVRVAESGGKSKKKSAVAVDPEVVEEVIGSPVEDITPPEETQEEVVEETLEEPVAESEEIEEVEESGGSGIYQLIHEKLQTIVGEEVAFFPMEENGDVVFEVRWQERSGIRRWKRENVHPEKVDVIVEDLVEALEGEVPL